MVEKEVLIKIVDQIYRDQGVKCYFCQIIGKRWSFICGAADIIAAPVKYHFSNQIGIIADKEIKNLDKYLSGSINKIARSS